MMVRLNTRHELPQIATRQTQPRLDSATIIQPQSHSGGSRQAQANLGATQPSLQIDSSSSRRAYGIKKEGDLMAEQGQKGKSNAQAVTGQHSREGWSKATTAARRGDDVVQKIKADIFADYQARPVFTIEPIPDPQMQGYQGEVVGEPEVSDISVDIETEPNARIHYTPGSVETFLQNPGYIRHWISMDQYDVYA